jgi:hypothetical protein
MTNSDKNRKNIEETFVFPLFVQIIWEFLIPLAIMALKNLPED